MRETGGDVTTIRNRLFEVTVDVSRASDANDFAAQQRRCQILFLDIGPIFLDLLGLQIDLSRIVLDITAVRGPGNLLGNLLCAVAGLLDSPDLADFLNGILRRLF